MSDLSLQELLGRGRQLLGRLRAAGSAEPFAGTYSLLALRLERDLARLGKGRAVLVVAVDDDAVGVEATAELAWCLAEELGHSVLMVDGTFGARALSTALAVADQRGLSELLHAPVTDHAALQALVKPTRHPRVAILPHGGEDASTIPTEAVRAVLAAACQTYDFVLVQGSLAIAGRRSLTFGALVDAALLLAVEGTSTFDGIAQGQQLLNDSGARRVALVLASPARPRDPARR